jgi:hypothetical protein
MFIKPMCVVPVGRDESDKTIWEQRYNEMAWEDEKIIILIQPGFQTDFCSVPRIPWVYAKYGDRAHHEGELHDYTYRKDCRIFLKNEGRWQIGMSRDEADDLFLRAMLSRGHGKHIAYPMWIAVRSLGWLHYGKLSITHKFKLSVTFPEAAECDA